MWINQQRNVYSNDLYGNEERKASNDEIDALKDLYISLNGDLWESNYNWNEDDPCLNFWEGVYCNKRGNVIGLEFKHNKLNGIIPDSISKLTNLIFIHITNPIFENHQEDSNYIYHISHKLFEIASLKEVILKNVNLKQRLDTFLYFTSINEGLEIIDLSYNSLVGELPNFSSLLSLSELNLSNNALSGSLSNLNTLNNKVLHIKLHNNFFTGTIPSINNLNSNLLSLDLRNNTIEGDVPSSFFSINYFPKLEYVGLMLTDVNVPAQCKNIPFCIKRLFKSAQSIYDNGFELTNNELQFLLPH